MFVPLTHPPGHAQADFGEAVVVIGGVEQKAHFFVLDLPHSDACYVRAYPAALAEAWVDGHVHAFAFFGAVPHSRSYEREEVVFDPLHYLPLIEQKINALDQAAPLQGWELPEAFTTLRRLMERGWADRAGAPMCRCCA